MGEHQRLDRSDTADVAVQALLQLAVTGGAQHHDAAIAGAAQPPVKGFGDPLAAAHQHHRRLGGTGPRRLDVADLEIAVTGP
jgi:hypothetical protein